VQHGVKAEHECQCQEQLPIEADCHLQAEQEQRERLEGEYRVRLWMIANEMQHASPSNILPPQQQIECVTKECYLVIEAITRGGDHWTPCHCCIRNNPDECFWLLKSIGMNLDGRLVRKVGTGKTKQSGVALSLLDLHPQRVCLLC